MKLLVVLLSYRVKELTLECLRSLEGEVKAIPGMKVGICDNGNVDHVTRAYIHAQVSKPIDGYCPEAWLE
jgi:hypothetical protein